MTLETGPKILVVEDEPSLREALEYSLSRQSYQVCTAADGGRALELAKSEHPDLIVLDLLLPTVDGLEVCQTIRRTDNVPIIMLTALSDEIDKVVGLEVGADDYLTKPFSMRELIARIKAQLRRVRLMRTEASSTEATAPRRGLMIFGDLAIDQDRREVRLGDELISVSPREFDLLVFLAQNRDVVLSRDLILERVWDWSYSGGSRTVDVHIRWLREKIEKDPSDPVRITTVRGVGYRFEG